MLQACVFHNWQKSGSSSLAPPHLLENLVAQVKNHFHSLYPPKETAFFDFTPSLKTFLFLLLFLSLYVHGRGKFVKWGVWYLKIEVLKSGELRFQWTPKGD